MVHGQTEPKGQPPKDRRTAATVQRPAAFRKTQPDTVFSLTERPPKRKKFFSEFENGGTKFETVHLQVLRRPAPVPQRQDGGQRAGVSISSAYELLIRPGFPTLKVGEPSGSAPGDSGSGRSARQEVRNEKIGLDQAGPHQELLPSPNESLTGAVWGVIAFYGFS